VPQLPGLTAAPADCSRLPGSDGRCL